jgi:hypothetical protein
VNDSVDVIVIPSANFLSPVMDLSWLVPVVEGTTHPVLMVGVGAQFRRWMSARRICRLRRPD